MAKRKAGKLAAASSRADRLAPLGMRTTPAPVDQGMSEPGLAAMRNETSLVSTVGEDHRPASPTGESREAASDLATTVVSLAR